MTTIACNQTEMASDSMAMVEASGFVYTTKKIYKIAGALIGISGSASGAQRFLEWYEDGRDTSEVPEFTDEDFFVALVLEDGQMRRYEGSCWSMPILDDIAASGDGAAIALAAMRLGRSPKEAVELACELNGPTGPPVVVERLEG